MNFKKVKIVATLGPASHNSETILQLAESGVDVFRINFSHATPDEAADRVRWIREAEEKLGRTFGILGDLPGIKIRIGDVEPETVLKDGQTLTIFSQETMGSVHGFSLNYPQILEKLEVGAAVYIDDGNIKLVVEERKHDGILAKVLVGGVLKPRKGFSAEGIMLETPELSERDKMGIEQVIKLNLDFIAVSFVQTPDDIVKVKNMLPPDSKVMTMAKIETIKGVENADAIMEIADCMMIARGDLGLAVPLAKTPHIQKELIELCIKKAKPVLTATQMLESMIYKPLPTRAEVTDVANAILDGTDGVMLSAETAEGKFPVETVQTMTQIIEENEKYVEPYEYMEGNQISNAIGSSIGKVADQVGARLIVAFTQKGTTARRISRHRHREIIIAATPEEKAVRQLNLSWGVYPTLIRDTKDFNDMREQGKELAVNNPCLTVASGEPFVIAAGMPFGQTGSTNMIFVEKL